MGKFFTIEELCRSEKAAELGIDNTPDMFAKRNMEHLITNLLDPLREAYGKPITVTSGFRCKELNRAVKGTNGSQHMKGEAADITAHSCERNKRIFKLIQSLGLEFDQLIDEKNYKWIHVSLTKGSNRKQILHL